MREADQIREYLIGPVLQELGLWSESAEVLMLGTAAHESLGFTCIRQIGKGPALSMFQIEPASYASLLEDTMPGLQRKLPMVAAAFRGMVPRRFSGYPPATHLLRDAGYACAVARLLYWRKPGPLPQAANLPAMAAYWKTNYNTAAGAGQVSDWLASWAEYCA